MATTTAYYVTGATVRAVIRNAALQFADVVHEAMDTYNASDIDDYDIACTEIGNIGEYHVTWPTSWMAVGAYNIQYVPLAGGSIVESDMLNRFSASNYYWDGTNLVPDWAVKLAISASPITDSIEELTNATVSDKTGFKLAADGLDLVTTWTVGITGTVSGNAVAGDAMTLTAGERDSIATALLDLASAVDTKTVREALRYIAAAVAGKVSGAGTDIETFSGLDGVSTRMAVTADEDGNRTAISYD